MENEFIEQSKTMLKAQIKDDKLSDQARSVAREELSRLLKS